MNQKSKPETLEARSGARREAASSAHEFERRTFTRIAWRFLPILIISYIFDYMDRTNVGFAALGMNRAIGLSATQFGTGAGILFLGYCVFEMPSTIALHRFGTRVWISRIMITWGLVSTATIFITGPKSWYLLRFLLGVAEAGFYPGIVYYLSTWFPAEYRARALVWFLLAIPASTVVGAPLSGFLLGMHAAGISGWKWLFILEGLPVVLLGLATLWILVDRPEDASWLSEKEKALVRERIASEKRHREVRQLLPALKDSRVLLLALIQFGFTTGSYGIGVWFPQIVKGARLSNFGVGIVTGISYLLASAGMLMWAARAETPPKKIKHMALGCALSAVGLVLAVWSGNFALALVWITVALLGLNAARAIFWTIPGDFMTGIAAAGGLAFINSIGTIGGFLGPFLIGWLKDLTGTFSAGLIAMAACLVAATVLSWLLKFTLVHE